MDVWQHILSESLADGSFKAKPDPMVIGHGLDKVQEGLDLLKGGVSATKVVVTVNQDKQ